MMEVDNNNESAAAAPAPPSSINMEQSSDNENEFDLVTKVTLLDDASDRFRNAWLRVQTQLSSSSSSPSSSQYYYYHPLPKPADVSPWLTLVSETQLLHSQTKMLLPSALLDSLQNLKNFKQRAPARLMNLTSLSNVLTSSSSSFEANFSKYQQIDRLLESLYGAFLSRFPTAAYWWVQLANLLMERYQLLMLLEYLERSKKDSAAADVQTNKFTTEIEVNIKRLERVFEKSLGVGAKVDDELLPYFSFHEHHQQNNNNSDRIPLHKVDIKTVKSIKSILCGPCSYSVNLWKLLIQHVGNLTAHYQEFCGFSSYQEVAGYGSNFIFVDVVGTIPSLGNLMPLAATSNNLHPFILQCHVRELALSSLASGISPGLDEIYLDYLQLVKEFCQEETASGGSLNNVTFQIQLHLRSVYQRALRTPMKGLPQLYTEYAAFEGSFGTVGAAAVTSETRLPEIPGLGMPPTPPVAGGMIGGDVSSNLAQTLLAEYLPIYQGSQQAHMDLMMYGGLMLNVGEAEGKKLATLPLPEGSDTMDRWEKFIYYLRSQHRTNQSNAPSLIRQAYKMWLFLAGNNYASEVWVHWARWEATQGYVCPLIVLTHALKTYLPDSALLSMCLADLFQRSTMALNNVVVKLEENSSNSSAAERSGTDEGITRAIKVYEDFVSENPCALGFILLQRLVRKQHGISAGRSVFNRARRVLVDSSELNKNGDTSDENILNNGETNGDISGGDGEENVGTVLRGESVQNKVVKTRKNVLNDAKPNNENGLFQSGEKVFNKGVMTPHLYLAHAQMELYQNFNPVVAMRVFELGLAKHPTVFLRCLHYVLSYASLLLHMNKYNDLKSLLERAINAAGDNKEIVDTLWDLVLQVELRYGGESKQISYIESRKTAKPQSHIPPIMKEEVNRIEGERSLEYLPTSLDELSHRLDLLQASTGTADSSKVSFSNSMFTFSNNPLTGEQGSSFEEIITSWNVDKMMQCGGGLSDYFLFQRLQGVDTSASATASKKIETIDGGSLLLDRSKAARERIQTQQQILHQQQLQKDQDLPEWLKVVVDVLSPVSRIGVSRPPPHLVEIVLQSLKKNTLPKRPVASSSSMPSADAIVENSVFAAGASKKRRFGADGDSSDDEDTNNGIGGGHGMLFKMRQRVRQSTDED